METILNLEIDRLVIEGMELTPLQRRQLKTSLETSLDNLFTKQGIPKGIESLSSIARMPATPVQLTKPEVQPVQLGEQIANSIYQGLNKQV
jgi:hypothetical protein